MSKLPWEPEAEAELSRVPFFVRPLARRKVEERVRQQGGERVTQEHVQQAEARFRAVMGGQPEAGLQARMPQPNRPGADLVAVEICHCELSGCPNKLIDPLEWKQAIEHWARDNDISERLRARVAGDRVLNHHKLRISISGCPNGCSRPQIADVGLMGYVVPAVDPADCTACGACAEECPDSAITVDDAPPVFDLDACRGCTSCFNVCPQDCISLSEPGVRILMGGKLGRHPHLAEHVGTADTPADAIRCLDEAVNAFLDAAGPGERFANFWILSHS